MHPKVLVLLSTYNGEKYLVEQLTSIFKQTDVIVKILARDDGSQDNTISILHDFATRYPGQIDILDEENIGCSKSFIKLVKIAAEKYADFDFYAFSDQDDVWLPEKLQVAVAMLSQVSNPMKVYYCHPQLVDQNLKPLSYSSKSSRHTLGEAFQLQPCIGCSMVFSPAVLNCVALCKEPISAMHDNFTYKLNLALKGTVCEDKTPHILYRMHASNVIGGGGQSLKKRWKRRISSFFISKNKKSDVAKDILRDYDIMLQPREKEILTLIATYPYSFKNKIKVLFSKEFVSNRGLHNIMFKTAVLFNKL